VSFRLWNRCIVGMNGCWVFTGYKNPKGYGRIDVNSKPVYAHRLAFELAFGPIPDGLWVLHRCDNPSCCNPEHLWLGTNNDNIRDMLRKDRSLKGVRHPQVKLTQQDVTTIRELYAVGMVTQTALSEQFGVSRRNIYCILRGKTWR